MLALALGFGLSAGGCAMVSSPVNEAIFTSVEWGTQVPEDTVGSKTGTASCTSLFGLFATGDASVQAAAADGNITLLKHADQRILAILGLVYYRQTTVVYGD